MKPVSIELTSHQLQLLAINAMFEHARLASQEDETCVAALKHIVDLGNRVAADPHAVRCHELNDAEAEVLYHACLF
ncbi:MAG: hypothetical protein H6R19_2380 [Proteobacteria bacterium]|nr:hypothetical protein [Pseudomonadota bacterium]